MRLGLPGIPDFAESIAIASILQLTASLKLPIHFHKLSSAVGVELIAAAQQNGQPVTADVAVAHLHLCDHDLYIYNPNAYVIPPLRGEADRQALRRALADGVINAVCSDHQPMSIIDKSQPFAGCTPGVSTWETLLPLTLSALGGDVVKTVARLSTEPARILGLTEVGCLTLNAPVNLCIWDPEAIWRVVPDQLASQGKNTPFGGWLMNGAVRATFLNGHMVYRA